MAAASSLDDIQLILIMGKPEYNNFDEPRPWSNRPEVLMGLTITFLALSWIFVSFRLYVRLRVVRSAGWDDLFVALYLFTGSVGSVAFIASIQFGLGQHMLLLTLGEIKKYLVCFYITNCTLNLATTFIKLSLLFQYLRIFTKGTWTHTLAIGLIVAVACWGFVFSFLAFVPCNIGPKFLFAPPGTKCWAYGSEDHDVFANTFKAHTILNMIFDLMIALMPIQLYRERDMNFKARMGLMALLCMGALVNFLSIWRMQSIVEHHAGYYPTHDATWYGPISILLGVLEINAASVCASVPIFWPMVAPLLGTIFVTHEVSVQVVEYRDAEEGKRSYHRRRATEDIPLGPVMEPLPAAAGQGQGQGGGWRPDSKSGVHTPSTLAPSVDSNRVDSWFRDTFTDDDHLDANSRRTVHSRVRSESSVRRKNSVRKWFQL